MQILMRTSVFAAFLAALALAVGCEDSLLTTAVSGETILVVANPGTAALPPGPPADPANPSFVTIEIVATVLTKDGAPKEGVTVFFSSNGQTAPVSCQAGTPPECTGVKTNSSGRATDSLDVTQNDADEVVVTARSGSIVADVTIPHTTNAGNHPPAALIVPTPRDEQVSGRSVVFDGSSSSDQDAGDFITMYKWVITSTNPDADKPNKPVFAEGPGVSGVSFPSDNITAFANIQDLTVTLWVTDDPGAPAIFAATGQVAYRSQVTLPYQIVAVRCGDNTTPTAVIAGAATQQIFGPPGAVVSFLLDGTLSSDPETPIESYTWNCGNGSIPLPQAPPSKAICKYTVDQTPRTYTATLVVKDQGTGVIDPNTGQYTCAAESLPASIQVVVSPLAGVGP